MRIEIQTEKYSKLEKLPYRIFDLISRMSRRRLENDTVSRVHADTLKKLGSIDNPRILEIGSRNAETFKARDQIPNFSEYIGFDIIDGDNVDVVGDAHSLGSYFENDYFDIVVSISVFEHLLFPWKVALEINKVVKPGGFVITQTHPAWPEHEMPWDFWRFPRTGFVSLFNEYTGFEIEEVVEGRPMRVFPLYRDWTMRRLYRHPINGTVYCVARKTKDYDRKRLNWDLTPADVTPTTYPVRG